MASVIRASVVMGSIPVPAVDLIENGRDVAVTEENKDRFIKLMVAWRTEFCVSAPLKAFLEGFETIVPLSLLQVFSVEELVCARAIETAR